VSAAVSRLVVAGSVLVDLVMFVPALPERGGDVLADDATLTTGGGYNVASAAARQGLPAAYAGKHGTGPFGDTVRRDLAADGIALLLPPSPEGDTGFCVGLVEADGERTYATRPGVEGTLTAPDLQAAPLGAGDAVYLSGYDLAYRHGVAVGHWFDRIDAAHLTVFDPGPLAGELPAAELARALRRADWVSANGREAALLTGLDDPAAAAARLAARSGAAGCVVRVGPAGCILAVPGAAPVHVPVPLGPVPALDSGGAGDTHVGAFVAALGRGLPPVAACRWANAAAARCVRARGPANGPRYDVTAADVARADAGRVGWNE
jgi:sugar/nucleoside kinase (ribokinase family)